MKKVELAKWLRQATFNQIMDTQPQGRLRGDNLTELFTTSDDDTIGQAIKWMKAKVGVDMTLTDFDIAWAIEHATTEGDFLGRVEALLQRRANAIARTLH